MPKFSGFVEIERWAKLVGLGGPAAVLVESLSATRTVESAVVVKYDTHPDDEFLWHPVWPLRG